VYEAQRYGPDDGYAPLRCLGGVLVFREDYSLGSKTVGASIGVARAASARSTTCLR
jgi:hypothetical protein